MTKKKTQISKLKIVALASVISLGSGLLGLSFGKNFKQNVPAYQAVRVIDGDTFETKEKQWIRISGIDSPEKGFCGYEEAKKYLEKLILGKDLYIKVMYHDSTRQMGIVYSKDGLVAEKMLSSGWAEYNDRENLDLQELAKATKIAQSKKRGLYGFPCTQITNPNSKTCNIKANVWSKNILVYHLPGCKSYKTTDIQLHHGDKWFCTEEEAQKAGFKKAETCPD